MSAFSISLALLLATGLLQDPPAVQEAGDPALRAAVERFFFAQQAEDIEAYLAQWSATATRPRPEMLKYIFDTGDDVFSEIQLTRVMRLGARVRVRVSALRERTQPPRVAGGAPIARRTLMDVSLTFIREGNDWKLLSEGPASDDLALALIESGSEEERKHLLAAEPELLNERLILSISRRAGRSAQMQNFAAARIGYERMLEVARRIGNRKYEGEALQNLGNAFYYQRDYPAALEAYEQRLGIEHERGDDEGAAAACGGIATIRYALAEYGAALAAYRDALAIHERLNDTVSMATALLSIGNALYMQGDFTGAIADYTRSRELYRKATSPAGEARALEGLGRVFLARGDYPRALEAFTGVLEEGRARGDRLAQGSATLNIGDAHLRLGNLGVARATFEESRGHFESAKDTANVGRVWQAIALTDLMAGRFERAEDEYRKSRVTCSGASDQECVAGAAAGLGFAQTAQDKFAEAIASYTAAVQGFGALRRPEQRARAEIGLAQAFSGSGDHKSAIKAATEARHTGIGLDNDDVVWRALVAEARALRGLNEREPALAVARAAAAALEQQVERARTQPASPVPRDSAAVFATLAVLQAEAGDASGAFESAERLRVHDLRISLARAEREIARGMTDAEREEERSIAAELVTLHTQLAREKALPKPDPDRVERLNRTIGEATAKRGAQERRLFERLPDLRIWRGLFHPASHSEAETILARDAMLLEFVVGDDDLLIVTARRGESGIAYSAHVRPINRKSLADRVAKLAPPEVSKDVTAWRKATAGVLEMLPERVLLSMAASSRVIVVPHEVLWRVPFEALPLGSGFLADKVGVRYAHSISALLRVPPPPSASGASTSTLLLAAAPELHESLRARIARIAPGWKLRPPDSAATESAAVAGDAAEQHVTSLTGQNATESALREHLPSAGVIHIGAPFRINGAGALFSPILLAGNPGGDAPDETADPGDNASLDTREVMNLQLQARVAVLSDGSAMAMPDAADDAAVVQWAWRAAGVGALAMPRWAGDAGASNDLLADFHARLRRGKAPEAALREAQRAIRRAEGRAAPFYWAGWLFIAGP